MRERGSDIVSVAFAAAKVDEGEGGTALFAHRFEVDALEPGAETTLSLGWPAFLPRLTRLALRPSCGACPGLVSKKPRCRRG